MEMNSVVIPATDDPDTAGFWSATRAEKLVVQRCGDCGKMRFPPRPVCTCGSFAMRWHEVSGRGRVWSYAIAHAPTLVHPALQIREQFGAPLDLVNDRAVGKIGEKTARVRRRVGELIGIFQADIGLARKRNARQSRLPRLARPGQRYDREAARQAPDSAQSGAGNHGRSLQI